jgi:rRNA processing protein Krr1/Pno1
MTTFITDYKVSFKIQNCYLLGAVIGEKGNFKRIIEEETETDINIEMDNVKITGKSVAAVRRAENKIIETLEANSFVVELASPFAPYIIGFGGENLKKIQNASKAYIKFSPKDRNANTTKLEIFGNPKQFGIAKRSVIDVMEEKIQGQMNSKIPHRTFRITCIPGGYHEPHYLPDQLKPNPQIFFLQFYTELNEKEEQYFARKINSEKKPPRYISKCSGILAPYKGYLYRAMVLNAERSDDDILLTVKYVDYGNVDLVS